MNFQLALKPWPLVSISAHKNWIKWELYKWVEEAVVLKSESEMKVCHDKGNDVEGDWGEFNKMGWKNI